MKYYLFLFCLFTSSSLMAMLGGDDNWGGSSSQHPISSLSVPCSSTDVPDHSMGSQTLSWSERRENDDQGHSLQYARNFIVNSSLEFNEILGKTELAISGLKLNFTPTRDQVSHLTNLLPLLTSLDLSDTNVTTHEIVPLVALKNLEYLDLSSTNVRNVEAVFRSGKQQGLSSKTHPDILRPLSHLNLSINLRYTIRCPLSSKRKTSSDEITVKTPEDLYKILNRSHTQAGCLILSFTPSFKQLQHIAMTQPNLFFLDLSGTGVTDVSPLSGLRSLEELLLDFTGVIDLSFISELRRLTRLRLSGTGVTDISSLSTLVALEDLYLDGTAITDISPLAKLLELRDLDLSRTGVKDVSPLSKLSALENLDLSDTSVTDVSPLSQLLALKNLHLNGTGVTEVLPLAGLLALRDLDLSRTGVKDVSSLSALKKLVVLYLNNTGIADISFLPEQLGLLFLGKTKITDISSLVRLKNLWNLDLSDTAVTDVSPLSGLKLKELAMTGTAITDVTQLAELGQLKTNVGVLKRQAVSTAIEKFYFEELLKGVARPLTQSTDINLRRIATKAADYLRASEAIWSPYNEMPYDVQTKNLCLQRARYEVKRSYEIQNDIKSSDEFMSLSSEEGPYTSWIRADMLASIEGRLVVLNGLKPSHDNYSLAQTEFAERELQSRAYFQDLYTKGFSEKTARIYQLLCLRYLCKHGIEPKLNVMEALKNISCEIMSRDSYAIFLPYKRAYLSLREANSLFRAFVFDDYVLRLGHSDMTRYYTSPEEASRMLQTYHGNSHLSLFQRLFSKLYSEL
ncbi:MAG: hypothetical protein K2P93_04710 [Alphaproteobacteria bacterium]|nr:hypothetical protein [Alphaproteobacteria bacterium]